MSQDRIEAVLLDIKSNQTSGQGNVYLKGSNNESVTVQNPLPTDGDSIYKKDISFDYSSTTGWIGDIENVFDNPQTDSEIYNSTVTNPKILYIAFNRTAYIHAIGFGCSTGKTFSNIKIEFIGSDKTVRSTYDDSTNNTKYGTKLYSFSPTACVGIKIYFYTVDAIGISNITIQKEISTISRIQGLNPVNIVSDVGTTYGKALKIAVSDDLNYPTTNTPTGELRVIEPVRLVGAGFEGSTIDTNFWTTGATGTGATIAQASCELVFTSGTANASSVYAYSVRRARYVTGSSMRFRCVGKTDDTGTINNKRRYGVGWGASMPTVTDGAWFQIEGTELSVVTCKGGVETKVTTFNGDLGQYTTVTDTVVCEIYYTNNKITFVVNGLKLHTVNASAETWTNTLAFHAFGDSLNTGALGESVKMHVRTASIYRLGKFETQPIYYNIKGNAATYVLKLGAGILHRVVYNNTSGTSLTMYDNTSASGVTIGTITTASNALGVWDYGLPFNNGLVMVTTGNGLDCTIIYE